jgi:hypothetical protein
VPRVFVAHKPQGDLERLHGSLAKQLVMLLTGLDEESVAQVGDIEFRDPVTDELITPHPNHGLVDALLACPHQFTVLTCGCEYPKKPEL